MTPAKVIPFPPERIVRRPEPPVDEFLLALARAIGAKLDKPAPAKGKPA